MEEIEKIRNQLGMTRKEFEEYYGIPKQTLYQWEKGLRKPPSYLIKLLNEIIERETKGEQLRIENFEEEFTLYEFFENENLKYRAFKGYTNRDYITWNEERFKEWENGKFTKMKVWKCKLKDIRNFT